jgi:hypothetical protein
MPVGQSPSPAQPQLPALHALPTGDAVQSTQPPPPEPQLDGELPAAQWPPWQQPPLQTPAPGPSHASVHAPDWQLGMSPLQATQPAPMFPQTMLLC